MISLLLGLKTKLWGKPIRNTMVSLVLALLLIGGLPPQAIAQTGATTVGALSLVPTFRSISVYADFTGDDNADNGAYVEYREIGGQWKRGMDLIVDRRATLLDRWEGANANNPFYLQWRGSIVGLTPNTGYEVRVTFSDTDGVTGTNPVSDTISTRDENIPLGSGSTYYVATTGDNVAGDGSIGNPWATIGYSLGQMGAGDTLYLRGGIYHENSLDIPSGTSWNNLTSVINYSGEEVTIDADGGGYIFLLVSTSYFRIKGLNLINVHDAKIQLRSNSSHFIVEDCYADETGASYKGDVHLTGGSHDGIIRNNIFGGGLNGTPSSSRHEGIVWEDTDGGFIIYNNTIGNDNYEDPIGGTSIGAMHGGAYKDSDIYDNILWGTADDGIELESAGVNVRVWGNTIYGIGNSVFSTAALMIGPTYVFYNVGYRIPFGFHDQTSFKNGSGNNGYSYGYFFAYNNTFYGIGYAGATYAKQRPWYNHTYRNNIFYTYKSGWMFKESDAIGTTMDYDLIYNNDVARWCNTPGCSYSNYTLSEWQAASGREEHGKQTDPLFVDAEGADYHLQASSPAIDAGVVITGFNDANGPYPYSGAAPDIGAFEFASGPPPIYTLTVGSAAGGSVTAPGEGTFTYNGGTQLNLLAQPGPGYAFLNWTGDVGTVADVNAADTTITVNGDYSITANFALARTLTMAVNGSGSTSPAVGTNVYPENIVVNITATPASGWLFSSWTGNVADPNSAVTTVTMDSDKTVAANFFRANTLTMGVSGTGSTDPVVGDHDYADGTLVTVSATPDSGWQFDNWTGGVADPNAATSTVTMDSSKTVIANFSQITTPTPSLSLPLRINAGGNVYTDNSGDSWEVDQAYVAGMWGFYGTDNTVDRGTGYAISGTTDDRIYQTERYGLSGYRFDVGDGAYDVILHFAETYSGITGPGQRVFDVSIEGQLVLDNLDVFSEVGHSTALQKTFSNIVVQDGQLNIDFARFREQPEINGVEILASTSAPTPTYTLTLAVNGGGSTNPVVGDHDYADGTVVDIAATPDSGWRFAGWSGDVTDPNSATTTVPMDSSKTVTADFAKTSHTLTLAVNGTGSTGPVPGTYVYAENQVVVISAVPGGGWRFDNWTGDVSDTNSTTTMVTMDTDKTVTANFSKIPTPIGGGGGGGGGGVGGGGVGGGGGGGGGGYIPPTTPAPEPSPTPIPPLTPTPVPTVIPTPPPAPTPTPIPTPTPTPTPRPTHVVTVDIDLEPGWNLFSFNVIPVLPDVDYVLASIHGQYSVVEGFNGTTVSYYPDQLPELNTLKTLDAYHGYWIKMEQAATLSITGTLVTSAVPLNLDEGWNLVSYLADSALPVSTALSSIDGLYTAVLGYDGQGLSFYPSLPLEMNTLSVLSPGHGYWIKMSTAATLFYSSD